MITRRLLPLLAMLALAGVAVFLRAIGGGVEAGATVPTAGGELLPPPAEEPSLAPAEATPEGRTAPVPAAPRPYPLAGRVTAPDEGPIHGARVRVHLLGFGAPVLLGSVTTDEEGAFEVDGVRVRAEVHEFAFGDEDAMRRLVDDDRLPRSPALLVGAEAEGFVAGFVEHAVPLRPELLDPAPALDVRLGRGFAWTGRVVDLDGAPVARAIVYVDCALESPEPTEHTVHAVTERDGRFALESPVGTATALRVTKRGYARRAFSGAGSTAGSPHDFGDLDLAPLGDIRGRIVAADGTPLPGFVVRALPVTELPEATDALATADSRGEFVLDRLTVSEYELIAQTPEARRAFPSNPIREPTELLVPPFVPTPPKPWMAHEPPRPRRAFAGASGVDVVAPGLWAFFTVRGPDGEPLVKPSVHCFVLESTADGEVAHDVRLAFGRLPSGFDRMNAMNIPRRVPVRGPVRLLLRASCEGLPSVEDVVELAAGQSVLRHTFEFPSVAGFGALQVAVTAPDGRPLLASRITLKAVRAEVYATELHTVGIESPPLERITPGRYRARITPHDIDAAGDYFLPFDVPGIVEIEAGRETHLAARAEEMGGRLEITVHLADSSLGPSPERAASTRPRVSLDSLEGGDPMLEARLGERGIQYFPGKRVIGISVDPGELRSLPHTLEPGTYEVRAAASGFESSTTRVVIEPGRTAAATLTLSPLP